MSDTADGSDEPSAECVEGIAQLVQAIEAADDPKGYWLNYGADEVRYRRLKPYQVGALLALEAMEWLPDWGDDCMKATHPVIRRAAERVKAHRAPWIAAWNKYDVPRQFRSRILKVFENATDGLRDKLYEQSLPEVAKTLKRTQHAVEFAAASLKPTTDLAAKKPKQLQRPEVVHGKLDSCCNIWATEQDGHRHPRRHVCNRQQLIESLETVAARIGDELQGIADLAEFFGDDERRGRRGDARKFKRREMAIDGLVGVWEGFTGKEATANWSELRAEGSERNSPFVKFALDMIRLTPYIADWEKGFAAAVRDLLERRKAKRRVDASA